MRHYYVAGLEKENESPESKITELEAKLAEAQRGYAAVSAAFLTRGTELTELRALMGEILEESNACPCTCSNSESIFQLARAEITRLEAASGKEGKS